MSFIVGETIEIPVTITDSATSQPVDPDTLDVVVTAPDATQTAGTITRTALGEYTISFKATDDGRWYWRLDTTGSGEGADQGYVDVNASYATAQPALTVTYATVQQVRDALGVDNDAMSDRAVEELILTAEDLIDQELGARHVDPQTGRRVVEIYVRPWQWGKLNRATIKLATLVYAKPDLALGLAWTHVKGPDFEFEGPLGKTTGAQVSALLDQSGLRRLTVSTRRGFSRWRLGYPSNADPVYDDE